MRTETWVFTITALFFTLCGVFGVSLALSVIVGVPALLQLDWFGTFGRVVARVASAFLLLGFVTLGLSLLYRFARRRNGIGSRRARPWRLCCGCWRRCCSRFT